MFLGCKSCTAVSKLRGWLTVFFFGVIFSPNFMCAGHSVTLSWASLTDTTVTGYVVYYGNASGIYTYKNDVGTNTLTTISGLQAGKTYYFAVAAYNAAKIAGPLSAEVTFIVPGVLNLAQDTNTGLLNIKFPAAPAHWYEVQASSDLKSWATIWQTTIETSNAWIQFSDPQTSLFTKRFYRLVLH
jgi:Fibronectin type III domain